MEVGPWTSQKCVKESCKVRNDRTSEGARHTMKSISTELRTSKIKPPFYAIVAIHALYQGRMMMQVSRGESGQKGGREQERERRNK